jgi:Myb-like DNA-binding domain
MSQSSIAPAQLAAPSAQYGDMPPPATEAVQAPTTPEQSGPPPAKKGRTNTPWTPAEEQRLKQMRDQGKSWSEIAKTFPNRTEGSVKKHWYKVRELNINDFNSALTNILQDMHYAEFDGDESQALLQAIKEYEAQKWKVIGQKLGKPAKVSNCLLLS